MSVGAVVGARDGLLVMVDGLKSEAAADGHGIRRVIDEKQRKFAISQDVPAVVVLTGPASLAGRDAWDWAERALTAEANDGTPPVTAKGIAAAAIRDLELAIWLDNINRQKQGYGRASEVHGFVACVATAPELGRTTVGEVWTFDFDGDGLSGPSEDYQFADPDPRTARPLTAVPMRPGYRDPDVDGYGQLPADVIVDHFQSRLADFRASPLSAVRAAVDHEMRTLITSKPGPFIRHGVGGTWTLIELRAGAEPIQYRRRWGPTGLVP